MIAVLLLVAGAVLFHRIGEHDYGAGFVVAGLSVGLGVLTWFALGWGRFGYLGGQLLLFGGLTWYNLRRHQVRRP
ncbi:MAG TPA: hypothetical protein VFN22_12420 [Gemmatimonadales bacterium]|nr:hypothetical protein [Gemmatimonadales bacterium]